MNMAATWSFVFFVTVVVFSATTVVSNIEGTGWKHPFQSKSGYSLKPDTVEYRGEHLDGFTLTRTDLYRLRKVLQKLPIEGSPWQFFYELAKEADDTVVINFEEMLHQQRDEFIQSVLASESLQEGLIRTTYPSISPYDSDLDENIEPGDIPEVSEREQVQGWEGCRRDYDMVMLPETLDYRLGIILRLNDILDIFPVPVVPDAKRVARPLVDANAKKPTGFRQLAIHWIGAVDQCTATGVQYGWNGTGAIPEVRQFKGKYVRLDIPLITSLPTIWPLAVGVCAPDTCEDEHIARYVSTENEDMIPYITKGGLIPRNVTFVYSGQHPDFPNDPPAKVIFSLAIIALVVIILASCYDGWGRHRVLRNKIQKEIGGRKRQELVPKDIMLAEEYLYDSPSLVDVVETIFVGFSVYSNLKRIYSTKLPPYHVPCLDGIKGITFLWLINGMSYVFGILYFETWTTHNGLTAALKYLGEWSTMSIIAVPYTNSAFYFACGFVCVQMFYKAFDRNNERVNFWFIVRYFTDHYWSLMPTVIMLLSIFTWMYRYLLDGPIMSPDVTDAEKCKTNWWLGLLMWNNLFRLDKQCYAAGFFYPIVWQLQIFSIFVLVPLVLLPAAGYVMAALMFIVHIIVFAIWQERQYEGELTWFFDILMTPWCQAGPYIIGMVFAMIVKGSSKKKQWHWCPILVLWLCAIAGILTVVYAPWDQLKSPDREWTKAGEVAFDVLAPQLMALCLGWITFACWKGYGGVVGSLLNWGVFTWMSKMLLPMTIFMGPIMQRYFYSRYKTFYVHENHMGQVFHAHLINIFIFGNIIALLFTYPLSRGVLTALRAKTRLETFLYARHPDILAEFTGDPDMDRDILDKIIAKHRRRRISSPNKAMMANKIRRTKGLQPSGSEWPMVVEGVPNYVPTPTDSVMADIPQFGNNPSPRKTSVTTFFDEVSKEAEGASDTGKNHLGREAEPVTTEVIKM